MFRNIILTIITLTVSISAWAADFTVQKLANGQTLVIQEVKNNPLVTIDTWVKTGSINETDANSGVAHFLEHLFFKGTKKHPVGEFDKILESKGAILNAATSKDFTHYYITIPSEYFEEALELHADMLTNPQIPRKELEKERKVVLEEIAKDGNNPNKKVFNNLNDMLYTHHPYKRKVIGSASVISTITREEILDFFNKYYAPSNMITLIVGDIEPKVAAEKVEKYFNSEYKKPFKKSYKKEALLQGQKRNVEYVDTQAGYLMIGFRSVDINNNETFALDVLAQILGGGKSSKLYNEIKEQKGIVNTISAVNASYKDDGVFYITSNFVPNNFEKVEKSIFEEIKQIQKYGITEEDLVKAQKTIEQQTYYSRESTSNIATSIGHIMTISDDVEYYNNYISNIKKVSAREVQAVAQKYLAEDKSAISFVLPKNMQNVKSKTQSTHTAEKISENKGLSKYKLDNNATLILNQHCNNDIVAITIFAKGGGFLEKLAGEGNLVASTMLKGTNKYSTQELASIMDENGIKIKVNNKPDYFEIAIQTTTPQLDLAFDILDEIINNATFDDYELEKSRNDILNKIHQKRDLPMDLALEKYNGLIFENSVYSNNGYVLEKTLPKITRADVLAYYKRIFDSKNIIISVNGNLDPQKAANSFGSIFSDKKQNVFNYSDYKVTKLTSGKIFSKTIKDLETAWLFLGWQVAGVNDKKDFVILKIINTLLGSGMSSRLYKNLREQDGLAYQLGALYKPNALGGNFLTFIGTNPQKLDYSREKILNEIKRLKMEFVSDTELKDAQERLKGGFVIALEKNSDKASNIGVFETLGFGYDFLDEYIKLVDEVTASDIVRVANKYFNEIYVESVVK